MTFIQKTLVDLFIPFLPSLFLTGCFFLVITFYDLHLFTKQTGGKKSFLLHLREKKRIALIMPQLSRAKKRPKRNGLFFFIIKLSFVSTNVDFSVLSFSFFFSNISVQNWKRNCFLESIFFLSFFSSLSPWVFQTLLLCVFLCSKYNNVREM